MTRDDQNIVIGILHGGMPGGNLSCKAGLVQHKAYTDLRDNTIQNWIKRTVPIPDVLIRTRKILNRNNNLQITPYSMTIYLKD